MASAESQDFSSDYGTPGQMNKYGFSYPQPYTSPHGFYPSPFPMTGYYAPMIQADNPSQDLMMMGLKNLQFTEISGTTNDPHNIYSFQLKLEGVDKTFTGSAAAKKKARKAAAQSAVEYLSDPSNVPEGLDLKSSKKVRGTYMQPVPGPAGPWGQMAQPPPGYMVPMPAPQYQQVDPTPKRGNTPQKTLEKAPKTPFTILREKHPDSRCKAEVSCTVTVDEQEFSVNVPGGNYQLAKMLACAKALKEIEGMEFPKFDRKLERVQENYLDASSIEFHPVSLLMREYGVRNVSFKQDTISHPCTVTIKQAGESYAYSSDVLPNKRQAKYEAALLAIKNLNLDTKYPKILPYQSSEDRKRRHQDLTETGNADDAEGDAAETGEETAPDVMPETERSDPDSQAQPEAKVLESKDADHTPASPPLSEKRPRVEPPSTTNDTVDDTSDERKQQTRATPATPSRYARGRNRGPRVLIRGLRGQAYGGYRGSQPRYY